jgi:multiple sugar transport system substrate-binding protein/sn-glycerol 3-phosphate transport system substrate-binding protein
MRKVILVVMLLTLVLTTGLVAAQDEMDYSGVDPSGVTITYWHNWDGAQLEATEQLVQQFNESNEWGITVEHQSLGTTGDVLNAISNGIVSGDLPNISIAFQDTAIGWYLDNAIVPLDGLFNDATWGYSGDALADLNMDIVNINSISPSSFPEGTTDSNLLLLWPVGGSANVMSVNLDMLSEVGFDGPAATLEDFRAIACATNELTGPNGEDVMGFPLRQDGFDLESWIAAFGGTIYEDGQYTFTHPATIQVLQFFQDLYNDGCAYIAEGFNNTADFANGLNPMAQGSTAGVPFINGDIEESGVPKTWINTIVPYDPAVGPTIQVFLRSLVIFDAPPEEQVASWLFLKYITDTDNHVLWTEMTRYFPFTASASAGLSQEFLDANPQFNSVRELLAGENTNIYAVPTLLSHGQVASLLGELVAAVTTGGENVEEAAARLEEEANEILAESME